MFQFRFQILDMLLCRFNVVRRFAVEFLAVALGRLRSRSTAIAVDGCRHRLQQQKMDVELDRLACVGYLLQLGREKERRQEKKKNKKENYRSNFFT